MKKLIAILGILTVSCAFIACTPADKGNGDGPSNVPPSPPPVTDYAPTMTESGHVYVHYYRADKTYTDYALWVWFDNGYSNWVTAATTDDSGRVFDVDLDEFWIDPQDDVKLNFIITTVTVDKHGKYQWGEKDGGDNAVTIGQTQKAGESYHWYTKEGQTGNGSNSFADLIGVLSHGHTYEKGWSSDGTYHFRKSTCGHDVVADKEYHSFSGGKCTVCNYASSGSVYVTFAAGDGAFATGQDKITVSPDGNGKVAVDSSPRADGRAFIGWYDGTTKFDPSAKYTTAQTFTAKYRAGSENIVYDALFDEGSTVSVQIDMSDAEWKKLNHDYTVNKKSPIYRVADSVTIGIDDGVGMLYYYYKEVGVRMKGNTSRHQFYGDNGFYDAIHMKLSFKQTFDDPEDGYTTDELKTWTDAAARKARKNRTFGGMEKIDIKYNSTLDETYVRELYAMKTFRDNGVVAPHITLGTVSALNKDDTMLDLGVYRIHECVDEVFVTRHFGEATAGDLWKCTWGNSNHGADMSADDLDNIVGVNDELNFKLFAYDKKTNKKKGLDSIKNFIRAINGSGVNFDDHIDTDQFAKFEAVNYMLGNPDCIRNNVNNYYVYFRQSDGKAVIIPYDYDRCLGLTYQMDKQDGMTAATPYTRSGATIGTLVNPLYTKLIVKGAPYGDGSALMRYRSNLISLAQSDCVKASTFDAYKNMYKARYSDGMASVIKSNKIKFDDNLGGNKSVSEYFAGKLATLNANIDNYRA